MIEFSHVFMVGDAEARVWREGVEIQWQDGSVVVGFPHDSDAYRETAKRYGYEGDTWRFCVEHKLTQMALAQWLKTDSPVMRELRGLGAADPRVAGLEESAVLAVQAYLRALGVDLIEVLSNGRYDSCGLCDGGDYPNR